MDVNFMTTYRNIPAKAFIGKSHPSNYSDAVLELDCNIGNVVDAIRAEPPNKIDKAIVDFPNIRRFPGGAANDTIFSLMDIKRVLKTIGANAIAGYLRL